MQRNWMRDLKTAQNQPQAYSVQGYGQKQQFKLFYITTHANYVYLLQCNVAVARKHSIKY